MDVFVVSEKDMAGNEEQAAAEVLLLLGRGEKVMFILADEIPGLQMSSLLKRLSADRKSMPKRAMELLSFASQVSKCLTLVSRLSAAGFSVSFSHGICPGGVFSGRCSSLDVFANHERLEEMMGSCDLLIVAPVSAPDNVFQERGVSHGIEPDRSFSSVLVARDETEFEIVFGPEVADRDSVILSVLDSIGGSGVSLDMINLCYDSLLFICPSSMAGVVEDAIRRAGVNEFSSRGGLAKLSFVGTGMKGVPGIMNTIYRAMGGRKIRILRTTDSHTTISCLIDGADLERAREAAVVDLGVPESEIRDYRSCDGLEK